MIRQGINQREKTESRTIHCALQHVIFARDFKLKLNSQQTHLPLHYCIVQGNNVLAAFWMFMARPIKSGRVIIR